MSGLNNHLNNVLLYLEDAFFAGDKSVWGKAAFGSFGYSEATSANAAARALAP
jgi:hypothetical protein